MTEWHFITGEYPPQPGGVSDYTRLVASALAAAGDPVHVWCPHFDASSFGDSGVIVHRELGAMAPRDLLRAGRMLNEFPGPRRLLVQWVPHAFGFRSANVPFSFWLWNRASAHKDRVEVMIHEPYLPLNQLRLKHTVLAVTHRIMLTAVLRAASRVWTAIPSWEQYCRVYALGRSIPFAWLPVVSNIAVEQGRDSQIVRTRYAPSQGSLIGHFGTCGGAIGDALHAVIPKLLQHDNKRAVLLIGQDSRQSLDELLREYPSLQGRLHATGPLSSPEVSSHLSACDVMLQPYPDGATARRSSLMAALSHGKPVVTTSGHLTEPLWQESGAVALVPATDYPEMIVSVERLLADEKLRAQLAAAARNVYDRQFGLNKVVGLLRSQAGT